MKIKKILISFLSVCVAFSVCVVPLSACSNSVDKYKPVYKTTNEEGTAIYD